MKNKSRKTGHFIGEVLIGLLFLFAVVGLFLWSVNRIVSSIEYKKSAMFERSQPVLSIMT